MQVLIDAGAVDAIALNAAVNTNISNVPDNGVGQAVVGINSSGTIMVHEGDKAALPCPPWCPEGEGELSVAEAINFIKNNS